MSHDRYSDDNPYAVIEALKTNMAWLKRRNEYLNTQLEVKNAAMAVALDEFHKLLGEPMYAGTREDWRNRCMAAENREEDLKAECVARGEKIDKLEEELRWARRRIRELVG